MIQPPPPPDEDVTYVGVWLDGLARGESYERDRWAPFIRCVIAWVGREAEWLRHARPLFAGTSRLDGWQVEGNFVEVPRALAARLKEGLQHSLSVRGILRVEQLDKKEFDAHPLAGGNAWLVGDVCVHTGEQEGSNFHEEVGLRVAYAREHEAGSYYLSVGARHEADHVLTAIVARGVHEPKGPPTRRSPTPTPVEFLIVRAAQTGWIAEPSIPAHLVLFDLEAATPDFEERLVETVSQQLAQKAYQNEVLLWSWRGAAVNYPNTYWAAITTSGHQKPGRTAALFKGLKPTYYEAADDHLNIAARPLLRWRPNEGLTRFWPAAPPPDTLFSKGKRTVTLRHRVAQVVHAVDEAWELRVDALELHHVRNHETFAHRFAPQFNVIIGDNARGKTTVLDALAAVLRGVTSSKDTGESLREDDVTEHFHDDTVTIERQYPARISATIHLQQGRVAREQLTRDEHGAQRKGKLSDWTASLVERVRRGLKVDLPLVVYYNVARAYQPTAHQALEITSPASRLSGYAGALDGRLDPLPFQRWFKTMELAALQERRPIVLLEVVREAVRLCIEGCETVQHLFVRDEVVLRFDREQMMPFRRLSDGYRLTLAMVADIAFRCVTLNPHLGPAATQETSGVVLIDELDLHLHPRWQRHIVEDLRRAFPRLQFIVTTHSPFIVQSMKHGEVLSLDDPGVKMDYQASSIEDIAEEAMGIEGVQRGRRFQEMERVAAEYYQLLEIKPADDAEALRLKARLDELMLPFADNPAYVAFLRVQRVAKGLS